MCIRDRYIIRTHFIKTELRHCFGTHCISRRYSNMELDVSSYAHCISRCCSNMELDVSSNAHCISRCSSNMELSVSSNAHCACTNSFSHDYLCSCFRKGSIYDFPCLTKVAASGKTLRLTSAFFTLLQRAMEDCLCDTPPSLHSLKQALCDASTQNTISANDDLEKNSARKDGSQQKLDVVSVTDSSESTQNINGCVPDSDCQSSSPMVSDKVNSCGDTRSAGTNVTGSSSVKRSAPDAEAVKSPAKHKRLKSDFEPAPCFFYNVHSKRLGKDHLPK